MKRHQLSPGITYGSRSTLSVIGQPVVGRGAQSLGSIKEEASTVKKSSTSSALSAAEITERVRAAVKDGRLPAVDADKWTELLADDPSLADLLEQLAAVPGLNDEPTSRRAFPLFPFRRTQIFPPVTTAKASPLAPPSSSTTETFPC